MADIVKQIIARPIQLADQIIKETEFACSYKQDCADIKNKTEKLANLLRQAARASNDLYERPTRRIIDDTEQVLDKTLQLVIKCRANGLSRLYTFIQKGAVKKQSNQIENSIGDVSWLLRVSTPANEGDDEYVGLPPIAANEPILCLIWEQIAILCCGTLEDRADAAGSLVSLARDNDRYGRLIIEEGGVPPLLKLAKEGRMEGQESAIRAIGLLARDKDNKENSENVEQIINAGICSVFSKILKEGHMKVQIVVAWAVSELAASYPKCQDHFLQNNTIRLLVSHLAYETIEEHSKYSIVSKNNRMESIHALVMAKSDHNAKPWHDDDDRCHVARLGGLGTGDMQHVVSIKSPGSMKANHPQQQRERSRKRVALPGASIKGREFEDPATKSEMKAMAARALWHLCYRNFSICKTITESRALLCFAVLLEKGEDEVKYNSAMALLEITAEAERHSELRRSAFKPTSPTAREVVDKLLKIINKGESDLLIPSIQSIGNLARTFRATETRFIPPLVRLLDERETDVSTEAAIALIKFACTENYLHVDHCKAILEAGAPKHLIQLTYFGEAAVQLPALILLSYIALHVPDSETLAQEDVHIVLQWAMKQGHLMVEDPSPEALVLEAKQRLEIYQSRA